MDFAFDELTTQGPCAELFAQLFDLLPLGVAVYDVGHTVVYYNRAHGLIDDLNPAEVLGRPVNEVFRPFDRKGFLSQRCLETRRPYLNQPLFYYTRLGKLVNSIHNMWPLTRGDRLLGCICFVREYNELAITPGPPDGRPEKPGASSSGRGGHYTFDQIITQNQDLRRAMEVTARSADSESAIMIYGETGCGKEMFAQAAHYLSRRSSRPFLAVSCAAIPENLLEGLLFGTVKGAFTGAQDRPGLMEMADGGTLFLDEINSMPLGLQSKMLRAIQERTVKRVGGSREVPVSLKIISATNNHPHRAVTEGQLRPDLLYRLGVVMVEIPPLRARRDDLGLLAAHFIEKFNRRLGKKVISLDPAVMEAFNRHYWPGNVRELEHVIESAMNLVSPSETVLEPVHFSSSLLSGLLAGGDGGAGESVSGRPGRPAFSAWRDRGFPEEVPAAPGTGRPGKADRGEAEEAARLVKALEDAGGNAARAARQLNISPQLMHHKMKKYGLKKRIVVKVDREG